MNTSIKDAPPVSDKLLEWVRKRAPRPLYTPASSRDEVMFSEGAQSLLALLEAVNEYQKRPEKL